VRAGRLRAAPRTQDSLAVSGDGERWILLNCSPEVRAQIESFPPLHPRAPRDTPIAAIVLTNGDLDHCLGLFSLRESQPLSIWATDSVRRGITEANAIYKTLERFPGQATWGRLPLDGAVEIAGLTVQSGRFLVYAPGAADLEALRLCDGAECVLFDGTFFRDDELPRLGLGERRARDMAHVPVGDSLPALAAVAARRKIYVHVNNTNPLVDEDSPERRAVAAAGCEVAHDGLELSF
jgi:pyrroloquinoline quinone biosynthesis protein B